MFPGGTWWAYALLGLLSGVFGASLGVGGGIIMVPALVILFQFPQKSAQGMSLAVMVLMALAASLRYWADPATRMDLRIVGLVSAFAIVGAVAGSELARIMPAGILQKAFAVVLIVAAVRLAFFSTAGRRADDQPKPPAAAAQPQNPPGPSP